MSSCVGRDVNIVDVTVMCFFTCMFLLFFDVLQTVEAGKHGCTGNNVFIGFSLAIHSLCLLAWGATSYILWKRERNDEMTRPPAMQRIPDEEEF